MEELSFQLYVWTAFILVARVELTGILFLDRLYTAYDGVKVSFSARGYVRRKEDGDAIKSCKKGLSAISAVVGKTLTESLPCTFLLIELLC